MFLSPLADFFARMKNRRRKNRPVPTYRPQLESLEERLCPSAYSNAVLTDGPIAYYRLNDAANLNVPNYSNNDMIDSSAVAPGKGSGTNGGVYNTSGVLYQQTPGPLYNDPSNQAVTFNGIGLNPGYATIYNPQTVNLTPTTQGFIDPFLYPASGWTSSYSASFETWFKTNPTTKYQDYFGNDFSSDSLAQASSWLATKGGTQTPYTWTNPSNSVNDVFQIAGQGGALAPKPDTNNMVLTVGQTLALPSLATRATSADFLAFDAYGANTLTFTVTYADGSTSNYTQVFSNWTTGYKQNQTGTVTIGNLSLVTGLYIPGLYNGMPVTGPGIAPGTTITNEWYTSYPTGDITLSKPFTGTPGNVNLAFNPTEHQAANAYLDHNGGSNYQGTNLRAYSIPLTGGTSGTSPAVSITLPNWGGVGIVGMNLDDATTSTAINLGKAFQWVGIASDAVAFTGGTILSQGYASDIPGTKYSNPGYPQKWVYVGDNGLVYAQIGYFNGPWLNSSGRVNDGNWHHLVITYNFGAETLYVDGQVTGTANGNVYGYGGANGYQYWLGAGRDGGPASNDYLNGWSFFKGSLSESAIYGKALTASQVLDHYWTGLGHLSNLAITNTVARTTQYPNAVYTITVTNTNTTAVENGPEAGIVVNDPFPSSLYSSDTWTAVYTGTGSTGPASGSGPLNSTNSTITLAPGGTAVFTVNAVLTGASTPNPTSNTASATTPDMVPTLDVTPGYQENTLTWTPVVPTLTGSVTYNIYRGTSPRGEGAAPIATGVTGTSYTDSGLLGGTTTYYYTVTAVYSAFSNFESPPSNEGYGKPSDGALVSGLAGQYYNLSPSITSSNWDLNSAFAVHWQQANLAGSAVVNSVSNNYGGYPNNPPFNTTNPAAPNYLPAATAFWYDTGANNANSFDVALTGYLKVPVTGTYSFALGSDDGSMLYVGGFANPGNPSANLAINGNQYQGLQYRSSPTYSFTAGQMVPIEELYYGGPGGPNAAFLDWQHPSSPLIPNTAPTYGIGSPWQELTLDTPAAPTTGSTAGGTLAATTYYVKVTYVNAVGQTLASAETSQAVAANNVLTVTSPAAETGATAYNVYVGTSSGAETLQNAAPIALGTNWTEPITGLVAGAAVPTVDTTNFLWAAPQPAPVPSTGSFAKADTTTSGAWIGNYGSQGYYLSQGPQKLPAGTTVSIAGANWNGWGQTSLPPSGQNYNGALQNFNTVNRIASTWYTNGPGSSYTINVGFADQQSHQVTIYALDWDNTVRTGQIQLVDPVTGAVLDTENYSNFHNGLYLTWNVTGPVKFIVTSPPGNPGYNTTIDAIFFGGAGAPFAGQLPAFSPDAVTASNTFPVYYKPTTLSISKVGPATINAGAQVAYAVTVTNTGANTAYFVDLNDVLPTGETFVSDKQYDSMGNLVTSGPTYFTKSDPAVGTNGRIHDIIYSLASNAQATFYWTVKTASNLPAGSISNTVVAAAANGGVAIDSGSATPIFNFLADTDVTGGTMSGSIATSGAIDVSGIAAVSNPAPPSLFQTERTGGMTYTIPGLIAGGTYNVRLDFAELNGFTTGQRQFNAAINGSAVLTNFDVYAAAGGKGNKAVVEQFPAVANASGQIVIVFSNGAAGVPEINGIEISPESTSTAVVATQANLTVTKTTGSVTSVTPGNNLAYKIAITNTGPSDAQNVFLKDVLPASETFVSDKQYASSGNLTLITSGPTYFAKSDPAVGANGTIDDTILTLPAGATAYFTWTVAVTAATLPPGPVVNTVNAGSSTFDSSGKAATAAGTASTPVSLTPANLTIKKTASVATVTPGNNVTYIVTLSNTGNNNAANVVLTDPLPAGETLVSAAQTSGSLTFAQKVTTSGGITTITETASAPMFIGAASAASFKFVVNVGAGVTVPTVLKNIASAVGSNRPTYTSEADVKVTYPPTTITVSKTGSPGSVVAGGGTNVTYTLGVKNTGANPAYGITLTDPLPAGETFVSYSGLPAGWTETDPGAGKPGTVTFSSPANSNPLAVAASSGNITIVAAVPAGVPAGTLTNTVTGNSVNLASTGNVLTANAATTVTNAATLSLAKTVTTTGSIYAGGTLNYTLVLTNKGPSDAFDSTGTKGPVITDTLPAGETFTKINGTLPAGWSETTTTTGGGIQTATFTDANPLAPGTSGNISFQVSVAPSFTGSSISNTASAVATGDAATPVSSNTVKNSVSDKAVLGLTKTAATTGSIYAGSTLTYNLSLTNTGPSDAFAAVVSDPLPAGTTLKSYTMPATGWTESLTGGVVKFSDPDWALAASPANFSITVNVASNLASGTTLKNTAGATASDATAVSSLTVSNTIKTQSNLAVTMSAPAGAAPGKNLVYTVTVQNTGPSDARSTTVSVPVPGISDGTKTTFQSVGALPAGWSDAPLPAVGSTGGTVTFSNVDFAPSGTATTFTIVVGIPAAATNGSTITNTATAGANNSGAGGTPGSVTSNPPTVTTVNNQSSLVVTLAAPGTAAPGTNLTYTVTIQNNGPTDAFNTTLSVPVPVVSDGTRTTFVSVGALPAGWTDSPLPAVGSTGGVVKFSNPDFAVSGTPTTFTVTVQVPAGSTNGSTITNNATGGANNSGAGGTPGTVTSGNINTTVAAVANLSASMSAAPSPVLAGNQLTYTITVKNNGPNNASNASLTVPIPAGTSFVSVGSPLPGGWTETDSLAAGATTGNLTFADANLPSGASSVFTIIVGVPASAANGSTVIASAVANASDAPAPATAGNVTTVQTQAKLTVTKTAPAFENPGTNLTYTIGISNSGPSNAQGVVLTDPLPAGLTFVSETLPAGWTETDPGVGKNGTVTFTDASPLTVGSSANFTIVVNIPASTPFFTQFTNTITAKATTSIGAGSTLSASAATIAAPVADLTLAKSGPASVAPGQTFTYTLTLTNTGPNPATSTILSDPLPFGATFVSLGALPAGWTATNPGVGNNGTITFSDASFGLSTANFTIVVQTSPYIFNPQTLSNTASVSASDSQVPVINSNTLVTNVVPSQNAQYVYAVYTKLLGRTPDPSAMYWVNQLNAGMAPSTFVQDVEQSPEYLSDVVTGLYYRFLNRTPDSGGLQAFVGQLESGVTIEQVTAEILSSQEFYNDTGGTPTTYIEALYQDLLGRAADAAGLSYWLSFFNAAIVRNGLSPSAAAGVRYQIALDILTSTEYRSDLVNSYYLNYLYRPADLAGMNAWLGAMGGGLTDQTVLAAIFGSGEGYSKNS